MKIVSVKHSKNRKNCILTFESQEEIALSTDIVLKYGLSKGKDISNEEYNDLINEQQLIDVKQVAYNYASYKPRTVQQIRQKLEDKQFDENSIDIALDFLNEFGLIDDNKYAETFVKEYSRRKKAGPKKVEMELTKRGIDKELATEKVGTFYPDAKKYDFALETANKKIKLIENKPKEKKYRAVRDNLMRKGFEYDLIKEVLKEVLE